MRILVTGGTGTVGQAVVTELVRRGHAVRLLTRGADEDAAEWPAGVEPRAGDVGDAGSIAGAADGCEAVLHLAGIVREEVPERTFLRVNVGGTRNVVAEAARAGVRRLVYSSSLGTDHGSSPYHGSKREAERRVREFPGAWTICRLGNVYGPGDEVISLLLRWVRTLPVVPVVDDGDREFQPVWAEDAARGLVACIERDDLAGRTLELAGAERTCMNDVLEQLGEIIGRQPLRIPVPHALAAFGLRTVEQLGFTPPIDPGQLTMLREGSVVRDPAGNALVTLLGVAPTPLRRGLERLAGSQPEQLPEEGIGGLERKRFWVDIHRSRLTAEQLMTHVAKRFADVTPWTMNFDAEPGAPKAIEEGVTLTMELPLRGRIQVRVEDIAPRHITLVTLKGHPLAGAVRLQSEDRDDGAVRFEIRVYDRAAHIVDWLVMNPVGSQLQNATWRALLDQIVTDSGGEAPDGIQHESDVLDEGETRKVEGWIADVVRARKRAERAGERQETVDPGGEVPPEARG